MTTFSRTRNISYPRNTNRTKNGKIDVRCIGGLCAVYMFIEWIRIHAGGGKIWLQRYNTKLETAKILSKDVRNFIANLLKNTGLFKKGSKIIFFYF